MHVVALVDEGVLKRRRAEGGPKTLDAVHHGAHGVTGACVPEVDEGDVADHPCVREGGAREHRGRPTLDHGPSLDVEPGALAQQALVLRGGGGGDRGGAQVVSVVGVPCLMCVWVLARDIVRVLRKFQCSSTNLYESTFVPSINV